MSDHAPKIKKTTENIKKNGLLRFTVIVCRLILSLCLFASLIALFVSVATHLTVLNRAFFIRVMTSETYIEKVQTEIENAVKTECRTFSFPYEAIEPASDTGIIRTLSAQYASGLYDTLFHGSPPLSVTYPADLFYKRIAVYAVILSEDSRFATESAQRSLAGFFGEKADFALNSFAQKNITDMISDFLSREALFGYTFYGTASKLFFPLAQASLLLILLLLAGRKAGIRSRLYGTCGVIWCSAATVFVPFLLLFRYDLPGHLSLAQSPLKNFLSEFLSAFIGSMYVFSVYFFSAATAALFVSTFLLAEKKKDTM